MRENPRICLLLAALAASCLPATAEEAVPVYRAARTMDPIRIDGKLHEFTWAAAPRVGRFRNIRDLEQRDTAPTEAAIVWDDQNLYVAFACYDRTPWSMMLERDSRLWEHEVVEVFLDPDGDGLNYPELEVSPHNVVVDLLIPRPRSNVEESIQWNIDGLQTAVSKQAAGWIVEIAIPWKSLAASGSGRPPRPGDRWRAGLYRIERPGGPSRAEEVEKLRRQLAAASPEQKQGLEGKLQELQADLQLLAWSPTRVEKGFHDPERFGVIEFVLKP